MTTLTFDEIETALDAGKLEGQRPHGDWVRCRRRCRTSKKSVKLKTGEYCRTLHIFMEGQVEAQIHESGSFHEFRIAQ